MTLSTAITLALADEFGGSPKRIAQWLAEHGYTLPGYLKRHGLADYADALAMPQERPGLSPLASLTVEPLRVSPVPASIPIAGE